MKIVPKGLLVLILLITVLTTLATFINRRAHIDDAWLGEHAYFLAKEGLVKSELFEGFMEYDKRLFVYHKLFIWTGALFINLVGWDLYIIKSLSLIFLLAFNLFSAYHFHFFKLRGYLFFLTIFLSTALITEYSFVFRPELLVMVLGFISYHFLERARHSESLLHSLLAGLFAGLAALSHLNGLMFIGAGCIALFFQKRYKDFFIHGFSGALILAFYFADVLYANNWSSFINQFRFDPSYKEGDFGLIKYVINVVDDHSRYFHTYIIGSFSLLTIVCAVILLKIGAGNKSRWQLIYVLSLVFILALIANTNTSKYLIPILPFFCLAITKVFLNLEAFNKNTKLIFLFTLVITVLLQWYYNFNLIGTAHNAVKENAAIAKKLNLPQKTKVLAPMTFIFNEIDNYDIHGLRHFIVIKQKKMAEMNDKSFFEIAKGFDREVILLDSISSVRLNLSPQLRETKPEGYTYYGKLENHDVFIREK